MKLSPGQIAPQFKAMSYDGKSVSSADYVGKKLWLAFFRYAACPLCNQRIHEIIQRHREFERLGIELIAVFQSPPERIGEYVAKQAPSFPLIADPDMKLYAEYGVVQRLMGMFYPRVSRVFKRAKRNGFKTGPSDGPVATVPADFLIDPEGLLWSTYYGSAISDHIPFETVQAFAADDCLEMPARAVS